jgi:Flp pilus assembly CpaE family ATPase
VTRDRCGTSTMAMFLLSKNAESQVRSAIASELLAAIPGLIETSSFDRVFEQISLAERGEPTTVLVVVPPGENAYVDHLVEVATQYRNDIFMILVSDEISASDYKRLLRTGGADWVSAIAGSREVIEIVTRRQQPRTVSNTPLPSTARVQPVTISFVPSAGGVGNTTLAVETAIHLKTNKAARPRNACIVDLDFQTSHVCDYLDSEPRLQIEELSNAPERLDEHLFDSFRTHHSSGIDVFAAPRSKFASEDLNINALDALFSMIAKRYDLVFIDFPVTWYSWTTQVIAASDGAVITGINTIPCLRQISETLALVRSNARPTLQIGIVFNRCERTVIGSVAHRKYVERVVRDERTFFISRRPEAVESVNMGIPMLIGASSGNLQKEFAPLAGFCAEVKSTRQASG